MNTQPTPKTAPVNPLILIIGTTMVLTQLATLYTLHDQRQPTPAPTTESSQTTESAQATGQDRATPEAGPRASPKATKAPVPTPAEIATLKAKLKRIRTELAKLKTNNDKGDATAKRLAKQTEALKAQLAVVQAKIERAQRGTLHSQVQTVFAQVRTNAQGRAWFGKADAGKAAQTAAHRYDATLRKLFAQGYEVAVGATRAADADTAIWLRGDFPTVVLSLHKRGV